MKKVILAAITSLKNSSQKLLVSITIKSGIEFNINSVIKQADLALNCATKLSSANVHLGVRQLISSFNCKTGL